MPAGIRDSAVIMCCQGGLRNNLCSDVSKTRSFVLSSCILFISTINSNAGYGFLIKKLEHIFIVIFHGLSLVMISHSVPKISPLRTASVSLVLCGTVRSLEIGPPSPLEQRAHYDTKHCALEKPIHPHP